MSEPTYTLAEAERELRLRECAQYGHSWNVIAALDNKGPTKIVCDTCGWGGTVSMGERPRSNATRS